MHILFDIFWIKKKVFIFILYNLNIFVYQVVLFQVLYYLLACCGVKYLFINIFCYCFFNLYHVFNSRIGFSNQYYFDKYYFNSKNSTIIFCDA